MNNRKWESNKIYKDDKTQEQIQLIQEFLNAEFKNIDSEVKKLKGIKNWKLANNIDTGYIVVFGSVVYYRHTKIHVNEFY